MLKFKSLASAAVMGLALAGTSAQAAFSSFWFDPDGAAGSATAFRVEEWVDLSSLLRVQNSYTFSGVPGPTTINPNFTFNQYGRAFFNGLDGQALGDVLDANQVTALNNVKLTVSGVGSGTLGGSIAFGAGTVKFYNPSYTNEIATFSVIGGGGIINADSTPNGQSTLAAKATSFDAGYFFKDVSGSQGTDYSLLDLGLQDVFGFSTTNLSVVNATTTTRTTIENAFLGGSEGYVANTNLNTTLAGAGTPYTQMYISGNGQYRMEVPEPESLALMGLGILALAASRRRKAAK